MLELLTSILALAVTTTAAAPAPTQPAPAAEPTPGTEERRVYRDPWKAYEDGAYDQALQGFVDRQVERPEDAALSLSVGSAHYEMRNFGDADKEFGSATVGGEPELRQNALYNLGNSAFRQGRLEEAVELYRAALEIDPEDEDAKFNLEFVRDEIRRRHEEAQKRQQNPSQGEDGEQQQPPPQQDPSQDQDESSEGEQQPPEQSQEPQGRDGDGDGLPDEIEREGENPTDPTNPDTDGDGLPDGAEDLDRDGSLDEGETDPNNADTDGDGVPDGEEAMGAPAGDGGPEPADLEGLTEEEAERYLQALEEGRPVRKHPGKGRKRRPKKDW